MELTLGDRIMLHRRKKGLSQQELSKLLGVNQSNVAKYENNKVKPNLDVLIKLADLFEVTTDYLLRGE